jgi:hypothetical protein
MRIQVGDIIKSTKSHPGRAGVVIAEGSSREQAKENANNAILEMQKQLIVR